MTVLKRSVISWRKQSSNSKIQMTSISLNVSSFSATNPPPPPRTVFNLWLNLLTPLLCRFGLDCAPEFGLLKLWKLYKILEPSNLNTFRPETLKMRGRSLALWERIPKSSWLRWWMCSFVLTAPSKFFLVDHNERLSLQWPTAFLKSYRRRIIMVTISTGVNSGHLSIRTRYRGCRSNTSLVVRGVFEHPELSQMDTDFMKIFALFPIIYEQALSIPF